MPCIAESASVTFDAVRRRDMEPTTISFAAAGVQCKTGPRAVSSIKQIEQITRREALKHAEAAWDAHRRLMRRCLRLKIGPVADVETIDSTVQHMKACEEVMQNENTSDGNQNIMDSGVNAQLANMSESESNHVPPGQVGPLFRGTQLISGMKILVEWIGDELKHAIIVRFKVEEGKKTLVYIAFGDEIVDDAPICACSIKRIVKILSSTDSSEHVDPDYTTEIPINEDNEPKKQNNEHKKQNSRGSEECMDQIQSEEVQTRSDAATQANESIDIAASVGSADDKNEGVRLESSLSPDSTDSTSGRKRRRPTPAEMSTRNTIMQHFMNLRSKHG